MFLFVLFVFACFSFLLYECALVTFFVKGCLTWLELLMNMMRMMRILVIICYRDRHREETNDSMERVKPVDVYDSIRRTTAINRSLFVILKIFDSCIIFLFFLTWIITMYLFVSFVIACYSFFCVMHYSAKRGLAIACLLSVSMSVCPSVCDIGGSWLHRLKILETNCTNN